MIVWVFFRSVVQWLLFLLALIFLVVWPLFRRLFDKSYSVHHFFVFMSKVFLKISRVNLVVEGKQHIDTNQSYIVTFNHFNFFDHFFLYGVLGLKLTGLEKEQHMKIPIYGAFMRVGGIIPIPQRGSTERALQGMELAKAKMKDEGYSILIAPEGTRCRDGKLGAFKKGAFFMAIQTQSPILPVVYDANMLKFYGRCRFLLRPCTVRLTILPPRPTQGMTEDQVTTLRDSLFATYKDRVGESYLDGSFDI